MLSKMPKKEDYWGLEALLSKAQLATQALGLLTSADLKDIN